jgi:SAM-dependent methyltransferase
LKEIIVYAGQGRTSCIKSNLRETDTPEYWDKKWEFDENKRERVFLDGSDGEEEFDRELRKRIIGKIVLDNGCGSGVFTLNIAKRASRVRGIDTSTTALRLAERNLKKSALSNVDFRLGDARHLPFTDNSFDVVYSRRGPGSDNTRTLVEAYRVLKRSGVFMEITIGERDKQNLARIFGRGQMLHVKGQVSSKKKQTMQKAGFTGVVTRDYLATEVFKEMPDLLARLQSAPIIPHFDPRKDRQYLGIVKNECMTDRGIETPVHRVVLIGHRSEASFPLGSSLKGSLFATN